MHRRKSCGPRDVGTFDACWSLLAGLADHAPAGALLGALDGLGRSVRHSLTPSTSDAAARDSLRDLAQRDRAQRDLAQRDQAQQAREAPATSRERHESKAQRTTSPQLQIEAQVHGGVELSADVEALVLDPSFRGTQVAADLAAAAQHYGFELRLHSGSELAVADVPVGFRRPAMPELARRAACPDGVIDAASIGVAVRSNLGVTGGVNEDLPRSDAEQFAALWETLLVHGHDARP